jgi:hypothetical protein
MTPAAAVAQIAVMQNRNRLYSHVDLEDVKHKADAALDVASETRYQLQEAAKTTMYNRLIMLVLLLVFLGLFIFKKYKH